MAYVICVADRFQKHGRSLRHGQKQRVKANIHNELFGSENNVFLFVKVYRLCRTGLSANKTRRLVKVRLTYHLSKEML